MKSNHCLMCKLLFKTTFSIIAAGLITQTAWAQSSDTLIVFMDMQQPIQEGWFDPDRETVGVRGDHSPLSWEATFTAIKTKEEGVYKAIIPFHIPADSVQIALKIKVDGTNIPNDGWQSGRNHQVYIRANMSNEFLLKWEDEAATPPSTITGQVEIFRDFKSKELAPRDLFIYLPPGYSESDQSYPVLYMHDGQNLFDAATTGQEWRMDEAAQILIEAGVIQPLIIVGIGNTPDRIDEYTPTRQFWKHELYRVEGDHSEGKQHGFAGSFVTEENDTLRFRAQKDTLFAMIPGSDRWQLLSAQTDTSFFLPEAGITLHFHGNTQKSVSKITAEKPPMGGWGDVYGDFIVQELKPFIDANLRTRPEAEWTALGGSSLGGLISLHLGLKYPDTFGRLIIASPSVWWDNRHILEIVRNYSGPASQLIWLDMGTQEGEASLDNARDLKASLEEKGWDDKLLKYIEAEGARHNENAWAQRVPDMLQFLFPATEK